MGLLLGLVLLNTDLWTLKGQMWSNDFCLIPTSGLFLYLLKYLFVLNFQNTIESYRSHLHLVRFHFDIEISSLSDFIHFIDSNTWILTSSSMVDFSPTKRSKSIIAPIVNWCCTLKPDSKSVSKTLETGFFLRYFSLHRLLVAQLLLQRSKAGIQTCVL